MTNGRADKGAEEFALRQVLLAPIQMGGPIWGRHPSPAGGAWQPSCSDDLPISEPLMDAIDEWFEDYLGHSTDEHLNPQTNPDFPFGAFNERGAVLADRLRSELGPEWTVEFERAAQIEPDRRD